jgi:hypothetical protein
MLAVTAPDGREPPTYRTSRRVRRLTTSQKPVLRERKRRVSKKYNDGWTLFGR